MGGENMSYPILYESNATDFFNLGLGTLPDAISTLVTEERNGEFILEMSYPIDGTRADLIKNNCIIKADAGHLLKDQRFVVKTVTPHMESNGQTTIQVYAEHISYLANDLTLKPSVSVADMDAQAALNQWKKNIIDPNNFTVDSDISTKTSTTWTIDKVQNARQALGGVEGSILDRWKGEYRFDNLHVSLLKARGTTANTLLAYGRNITDFQQEENIVNAYTSIYPYATLSSATGDKQLMYTLDDYVVDSKYVGNYPNRKTEPIDFGSEFENVKVGTKPSGDKAEKDTTYLSVQQVQNKLKTLAQQYIKNNNIGVPMVSIKISFVDLSRTTNYADMAPLEELDLCDSVPVRFSKLGINTTAKVSRVVWNVLTDSYDSLELGEISTTLGDKIKEISDNTDHAKNEIDKWKNIVQTAANGISAVFRGPDTPIANHIGDLWYKPNGQDTEMYQWDGVTWVFIMSTKETSELKDLIDQTKKDAETAVENAKNASDIADQIADNYDDINKLTHQALDQSVSAQSDASSAIAKAESTASEFGKVSQKTESALANAKDAQTNANTALDNAKTAQDSADSIKVDVDDVKGTLDSKADKTSVDAVTKRVTTNETNITQNAKDITSKANQTDVDAVTKQVSTAETNITQNANSIKSKASQSDVTALTGRVSSAESEITQNAKDITSKVSSSDIQGLLDKGGYATQKWTGSQIKQSANEINSTVTSVSNKVDNLQIGGRNLLADTSDTWNSGTASGWGNFSYRTVNMTEPGMYTANVYLKPDKKLVNIIIQVTDSDGTYHNHFGSTVAGGSEGYSTLTVQVAKGQTLTRVWITFNHSQDDVTSVSWKRMKLEKGNKATDWSPAPEDMATVTAVSNLSQTVDGIKTDVSKKIEQKDLNGYATETWAQNKINATADGINGTLSSVKGTVDGHTTSINDLQADSNGFKAQFQTVNDTLGKQNTDIGTLQATSKELSSNFSSLNTDNTTNKNDISQLKQTATELNSTMTTVQTQVQNSAVGTNLIVQSDLKKGYINRDNGGVLGYIDNFHSDNYIATNGETVFTFSSPDYAFKGATNHTLAMYDSDKNYLGYQTMTSATQTLSKYNVAYIRFSINFKDEGGVSGNLSDWLDNHRYKLEKGSVATDYSVNPEDTATVTALSNVDQKADSISSTVTNNKSDADTKFSNINQSISGIQSTVVNKADKTEVSQIKQTADNIKLTVDELNSEDTNLIMNSGFVNGEYWSNGADKVWYSIASNVPIAAGTYIGGRADRDNWTIIQKRSDDILASLKGQTVTFSVYARTAEAEGQFRIYIRTTDSEGNKTYFGTDQIYTRDSIAWQRYSITADIPEDVVQMNLTISFLNLNKISCYASGAMLNLGSSLLPYNEGHGDIVNQINVDSSGILISGKKVMIDSDTYIKNGVIKSAMIDTLDASKVTTGTLNAANVNIINLNVSKLVGNTTNFVQSAWNGIDKHIYMSGDGMQIVGDWGANLYDDWGIRSYAYNASNNLELVGNFSSTYAVGNKNINGTLVSADYEGDFVGIGYRNKVGDNFTPMVGYFKKDQTALGWYQGINIVGHLVIHDYIKPLGGTADYIKIGTIKFNNINYAYIGNSSGKAGFAYGTSYMYLISKGTAFRMAGWKIPVNISSDGKVKSWVSLPGSYN